MAPYPLQPSRAKPSDMELREELDDECERKDRGSSTRVVGSCQICGVSISWNRPMCWQPPPPHHPRLFREDQVFMSSDCLLTKTLFEKSGGTTPSQPRLHLVESTEVQQGNVGLLPHRS